MRPITQTNIFLRDDTNITVRGPMASGFMVLELANDSTQIFLDSREQAERLFDAVAEVALSFRERFPAIEGSIVVDAEVSDEPIEVEGAKQKAKEALK